MRVFYSKGKSRISDKRQSQWKDLHKTGNVGKICHHHIIGHGTGFMIVLAEETDGPQVRRIAARAGVFSREEVECVGEIWEEYCTEGPQRSGYNFIVCREGKQVLGFACYGPRDLTDGVFDLYWIAVDPAARSNGVGRALLAACEEAVKQAGGRMLIAETSGTQPYEPTRKFYAGLGYENEARLRDFYSIGDDLMIFVKRI
jgi:ribosomal protein S18 acetylase RimI-like enzyme